MCFSVHQKDRKSHSALEQRQLQQNSQCVYLFICRCCFVCLALWILTTMGFILCSMQNCSCSQFHLCLLLITHSFARESFHKIYFHQNSLYFQWHWFACQWLWGKASPNCGSTETSCARRRAIFKVCSLFPVVSTSFCKIEQQLHPESSVCMDSRNWNVVAKREGNYSPFGKN